MDKELKAELDRATVAMAKATALIKEGELIKKDIKEKILPLMASFSVEKNPVEGVGIMSFRSGGGSSINPKKLTEVLLAEGLDADRIPEIIDESTKRWTYDFVEFRGEQKKA